MHEPSSSHNNRQKSHIILCIADDKPLAELKGVAAMLVTNAEQLNIENGGSALEIGEIVEHHDELGYYHAVEVWGDLKPPLLISEPPTEDTN